MADEKSKDVAAAAAISAQPVMAVVGAKNDEKVQSATQPKKRPPKPSDYPDTYPPKKHFRMRAHCNPLSFNDTFRYPQKPDAFELDKYFQPTAGMANDQAIEMCDVGCGFGGLLVSLGKMFPKTRSIGFEIRAKVCEYVRQRITSLRTSYPGEYGNCAVEHTNAMRYMPNYFREAQLSKLFFCFPDPHFKTKNFRRRIINTNLLDVYAYVLRPGGILYTVTDVKDLADWMASHLDAHPLFAKVGKDRTDRDPVVPLVYESTEEGKKVKNLGRFGKIKYLNVFERVSSSDAATEKSGMMKLLSQNKGGAAAEVPKATT